MNYDPAIADRICERIAEVGSLRAVCGEPGMPSRGTVARWVADDPLFGAKFARAKAIGIDNFAEETLDIADRAVLPESVPQARLRVESRRWLAERMLPKTWGLKSALELSGSVDINKMTEVEIRAELAALDRKLASASKPDDMSEFA